MCLSLSIKNRDVDTKAKFNSRSTTALTAALRNRNGNSKPSNDQLCCVWLTMKKTLPVRMADSLIKELQHLDKGNLVHGVDLSHVLHGVKANSTLSGNHSESFLGSIYRRLSRLHTRLTTMRIQRKWDLS